MQRRGKAEGGNYGTMLSRETEEEKGDTSARGNDEMVNKLILRFKGCYYAKQKEELTQGSPFQEEHMQFH